MSGTNGPVHFHNVASFQPLFLYLTTSGVRWAKGKRLHILLIFSCAQYNESETADMLRMFTHSSTYSTWACFQRGLNVLSLSSTLHVVFPFLMKSTPRWTSQGFIRAQFVSRWLTALLAVLLLTPQLAFSLLSLTILKIAQGCRAVVHCKASAHSPTWHESASPAAVAAVADQKLTLCLLKGFPRTFCLRDFLFQRDYLLQSSVCC